MSELRNLVDLYRIVKDAQFDHCPMPDDLCDSLSRILIQIEDEVVKVPATSLDDVKAMFEMVPLAIMEDDIVQPRAMEIAGLAHKAAAALELALAA